MIGRTSLHGLPLHVNWSPLFFYPARPCVSEANARRRNNSICSIWCQSTPRSSQPTPTHRTRSRFILSRPFTARNMDQRRATTTTKCLKKRAIQTSRDREMTSTCGDFLLFSHPRESLSNVEKTIHTRCLFFCLFYYQFRRNLNRFSFLITIIN